MTKLKPCPFCGDKAEILETAFKTYSIGCTNPNCSMGYLLFSSFRKEIIKAWNTRTP